jgi:Zn2+/Cd2+-exporting ATPase
MLIFIKNQKKTIMTLSFVLTIIGVIAQIIENQPIKDFSLFLATIIASVPIFVKANQSIRMKSFSIELLVCIAVLGALYLQEYTESAVVTLLFLFGDYLEARTLEKTRSAIRELVEMTPEEANVFRKGVSTTIPVEEVVVGDRVIIRSGEKIPVDGKIETGKAFLNESIMTGESIPKMKKIGDSVFSGTFVDNGYIEIRAEKVGDDTTFAKLINLVEEAQESKTIAEKFLDKFASIYTPAVVLLSVIVFMLTGDLKLAITFLVIACPGALVIGAPVSSVAGIGNGAKNGVLVKGGEIMDTFSKVDTIVFDKTGTLTKGKPVVADIKAWNNHDTNELLKLIAEAETISEHHFGKAIVNEAEARGFIFINEPENVEIIKGMGIKATVRKHGIAVGNRRLMETDNIDIPKEIYDYAVNREKEENTAIFAAIDGEIAGVISIADKIREDAHLAISELRKSGIKKMIMLTGDNRLTAKLVAEKLGLDEYYAELLPEAKVEYVKKLKEKGAIVAMAGDGINDAPAIAAADIGLAMGEGGTDVSIETADVVLMADRLMQMSHAYSLSKATIRNIKQNTFFAVITVFLLLSGVLFGSIHLATGMFIHEGSVLLVILNAMRLIKFNNKKKNTIVDLPFSLFTKRMSH